MKLTRLMWLAAGSVPMLCGNVGCQGKLDLGSRGNGSALVVLATGQVRPSAIAVDARNVYWLDENVVGGVYSVPKTGGAITTLFSGDVQGRRIAVDESNVYFIQGTHIDAVPVGGGAPRVVTNTAGTLGVLAITSSYVYWFDLANPDDGGIADQGAYRAPLAGGAPEAIGLPPGSYFAAGGSADLVSADDALYGSLLSSVIRIPHYGGPATAVVGDGLERGLTVDDSNVYYSTGNTVDVVGKAGGSPAHFIAADNAVGLANDHDHVFLTDSTPDGRVLEISKADASVKVLVDHQDSPSAIAVDEDAVYFANIDEGSIVRVSK